MRGQCYLIPIKETKKFEGGGDKVPGRRWRVWPRGGEVGAVRVFSR